MKVRIKRHSSLSLDPGTEHCYRGHWFTVLEDNWIEGELIEPIYDMWRSRYELSRIGDQIIAVTEEPELKKHKKKKKGQTVTNPVASSLSEPQNKPKTIPNKKKQANKKKARQKVDAEAIGFALGNVLVEQSKEQSFKSTKSLPKKPKTHIETHDLNSPIQLEEKEATEG